MLVIIKCRWTRNHWYSVVFSPTTALSPLGSSWTIYLNFTPNFDPLPRNSWTFQHHVPQDDPYVRYPRVPQILYVVQCDQLVRYRYQLSRTSVHQQAQKRVAPARRDKTSRVPVFSSRQIRPRRTLVPYQQVFRACSLQGKNTSGSSPATIRSARGRAPASR